MVIGFNSGSVDQFLRARANEGPGTSENPIVQLSSIAGLWRYARLDCLRPFATNENEIYKHRRLQEKSRKRAIAEVGDPKIPENCGVDRHRSTLFTSSGTPLEEQLFITDCDEHACDANIRVSGVGVNLSFESLVRNDCRDHNADGIKMATGWISADDGIVVMDRDGNGTIDSGRELFGDNTLNASTPNPGDTHANG